jgi:hypothetical protein
MDYSLLIGVHDIQFTVNPHATLKKQAVKRRESLRLSLASHTPSQAAAKRTSTASSTFDVVPLTRVNRQDSSGPTPIDNMSNSSYSNRSQRQDINYNKAPSVANMSHHGGIEEEDESGLSITSDLQREDHEEELDSESKVESAPLNQTNVSKLLSGTPDQWNFEESESEIASESSAIVDILPSAVTDFNPDYTGFMQPDQRSEAGRSQAGGGGNKNNNTYGNEAEDENEFIMEDDETLLLAQLRDPTSPIFQSRVVVGPGLFYVGVVDTLQTWSWKKKIELFWKKLRLSRPEDEHGLSCIAPVPYAERFKLKIRDIVEHDFIRQLPST